MHASLPRDPSAFVATFLLGAILLGALAYCDQQDERAPESPEATLARSLAAEAATNAGIAADSDGRRILRPSRFSKSEFSDYAMGLTKAQVRREFGKPLIVRDYDDSWYYPNLPVFDDEAGIQVGVTFRFMGISGPDDEVVGISY